MPAGVVCVPDVFLIAMVCVLFSSSFFLLSKESLERPNRVIIVTRNDRFGFSAGTEAAPITEAPAVHC
jgi:hypothetical protein